MLGFARLLRLRGKKQLQHEFGRELFRNSRATTVNLMEVKLPIARVNSLIRSFGPSMPVYIHHHFHVNRLVPTRSTFRHR